MPHEKKPMPGHKMPMPKMPERPPERGHMKSPEKAPMHKNGKKGY